MRYRSLIFAIIFTAILCTSMNAGMPVGTAFTYQGKLTNSAGAPLAGSYSLSFKLFDDATGGSQIGSP